MTNTSGAYFASANPSLHLGLPSADANSVQLDSRPEASRSKATSSFRPSKDFFLCRDDGLVGRHGTPEEVFFVDDDGHRYALWVEQRAPTEVSDHISRHTLSPEVELS